MRTAVAAVLAGVLLAGCTSSHPRTSPTTIAPGTATSTTAAGGTGSTVGPGTSTGPSTTVPAVQNLTAGSDVKAQLLAAYAAAKTFPQSDFVGPVAGTTYYAYVAAARTYWATARFQAAPGVSQEVQISMQDGGDRGVFTRAAGGPWHTTLGGIPWPCPGNLPAGVMAAWNLSSEGSCIVATGQSPARSSVPSSGEVLTIPDGTYFGTLLYFDLQLDGYGTLIFEPETWQGSSPPVSQRKETTTLEVDTRTTTQYWAGSDAASSHAVSGHFDPAFAEVVKDAMEPFTTQPYSGYQITVTNPPGCEGACSRATNVVQIGPLTPSPAKPDFAEPAG